jgi:hypothetical protein
MPKFEIAADGRAIGYTELEKGDPPMGCASGRLYPLPLYAAIQPMIIAARNKSQVHLALTVQTTGGDAIPAQGGVAITDYSAELGPEGIEVEVLGIGYPLYEELFPGRHAAYVEHFRNTR